MKADSTAADQALFPGFRRGAAEIEGTRIPYVTAGDGPPLLLLHGHPQTHVIWHRTAPQLARRFTVVCSDLRGYGDAGKPPTDPEHLAYGKRAMARDQVGLMRSLGFDSFALVGHDRGGRVAHRLAVDHPQAVTRMAVLDIAPTLAMYEQTDMAFATAYFHWFFLIQPAPFPETLIDANPRFYLDKLTSLRSDGVSPFAPEAFAEYERCMADPACVHAMCEDYRAAATIDLVHDRADRETGRRIACPLLVLWGAHGLIERRFRPIDEWQRVAEDVRGRALDCGHYIPEEAPQALLAALDEFLQEH